MPEPHNQFRFELDGTTLTVPFEVMRLYRERAVNQAVGDLLATIRADAIERIDFSLRTTLLVPQQRR